MFGHNKILRAKKMKQHTFVLVLGGLFERVGLLAKHGLPDGSVDKVEHSKYSSLALAVLVPPDQKIQCSNSNSVSKFIQST